MTIKELIECLSQFHDQELQVMIDCGGFCMTVTKAEFSPVGPSGKPCHPDDADMQRPPVIVLC